MSKSHRFPAFLFLLILTFCPSQRVCGENGDVLATGTSKSGRHIEKIEWNGTEKGYLLVTYPKSFKVSQRIHLNFWFPGTAGNPGTGIADQNSNYIEICLSYLSNKYYKVGEYGSQHWELCQEVEANLVARKKLKVGQRIVSGVSKGGWMANEISLSPHQNLDGAIIIAAGLAPKFTEPRKLKNSHLAIFVCTGETDSNYPYAQLAKDFYRKCGVQDYCYEEWLTRGHVSDISPRVNEWLNVQALKKDPIALMNYSMKRIKNGLAEIEKSPDPVDQYISLRHLLKSPAASHTQKSLRDKLLKKGQALSKDSKVAAWLKDYNTFRRILEAELKLYQNAGTTSEQFVKIKSYFLKFVQTTEHTDLKIRAAYAYVRNTKNETIYRMREKMRAKPEHQKLETKLKNLVNTLNQQSPPDPQLVSQYHKLCADVGKARGDLTMKCFYEVEWNKNYSVDEPIIKEFLGERLKASARPAPYSGLAY